MAGVLNKCMISEEQVAISIYKTYLFAAIAPANAEHLPRPPLQTWSQRNGRFELHSTCVSGGWRKRKDACEHSRLRRAVEEDRARWISRHL
jgi:hypothetical protein